MPDGSGITYKPGDTTTLKVKCWDDSDGREWCCIFTVTLDGFNGNGLEYNLIGTWKYTGSSSNGIIILNKDMSGHITATLQGNTIHDDRIRLLHRSFRSRCIVQ